MKLSKETLEIINSFRDINPSIVIYPGNVIRTKSEDSRILAEAIVEETFEREFALYEIRGFLNAYNILGDPELIFSEQDYVLLKDGRNEIRYFFSEPSLITSPPQNFNIQLVPKNITFQLDQLQFNKMLKMTTFDSDRKKWIVDFFGDNSEIILNVYHKDEITKPSYSSKIGETTHKFCFRSHLDSFLFINGNYDVQIQEHTSTNFNFLEARNAKRNLRYILPLSPESTFEE